MAASSATGASSSIRKWVWLFVIVILVIGVYSAGWFYAANALKTNVLKVLGDQKQAGVSGECADIDFRGYPLRIGIYCSSVKIDDKINGISAVFGALRSRAEVYTPGKIAWELRSPGEIRTAHGLAITSQWSNLRSNLVAKRGGIGQTSTIIKDLKATIASAATAQTYDFTADHTEMHLVQKGQDLNAVMRLQNSNTVVQGLPLTLPTLSGTAEVTLFDKAGLIDGSDTSGKLYGARGELRKVVADIGNGRVMTLTGPFSFDDAGYLTGQFKLKIESIDDWRKSLGELFPDLASTINTAGKLLKALVAGNNTASVDLTVKRGEVSLSGFIPLGKIPPI